MITKLAPLCDTAPKIKKIIDLKDVSTHSAFSYSSILTFNAEVPRALGASAVVLRVFFDDTGVEKDFPLSFCETEFGVDKYSITVKLADWCGDDCSGLFYYEFLFLRGADTLFTNTANNVDFALSRKSAGCFRMLVYADSYSAPEWFSGGIMYHVFVDRFKRGEGDISLREDALINEDWDEGIPQYVKKQGDPLVNNMFFGGNLWGVIEELGYLSSLGVTVIYLSPIFKAYSNHKYDTGNYFEIDEMFGGESAFVALIKKAREYGIRIILDGVFNHTGDDSLYFDKYGKYGGVGAYSNSNSPFREWFSFRKYPEEYESWWGIKILPKLNHECDECREYFVGDGGVLQKYVKMGIGGWRLDVADELSDRFLYDMRKIVKNASNDEAILIGEVWENAADKIAYGRRRRYFRGGQLDSVMNYPLRNGILGFIQNADAMMLADTLKNIYSSYPKSVCDSLMNLLGTHDTERILTILGQSEQDRMTDEFEDNDVLAHKKMSPERYDAAVKLLKVAATIQYTVYGVPSVFYGDEAGLEGYHDPFCRKPYPWKKQNKDLLGYYRRLGQLRRNYDVFKTGEFRVLEAKDGFIAYERTLGKKRIVVIANVGKKAVYYPIENGYDLMGKKEYSGKVGVNRAKVILCDEV